jgi:hypothetical protein
MGYFKSASQETDRLLLPSDPDGHYYVVMKRRASFGDDLAAKAAVVAGDDIAAQALAQANGRNGIVNQSPKVDTAAYVRTLMLRLIVDWNLDDEEGQKLPITAENIDRLDPADGDFLGTEANKRAKGRAAEQQGPSKADSGRLSTATQSKTRKSEAS